MRSASSNFLAADPKFVNADVSAATNYGVKRRLATAVHQPGHQRRCLGRQHAGDRRRGQRPCRRAGPGRLRVRWRPGPRRHHRTERESDRSDSGATLTGTANLAATASDNVGVARVEFRVDGATVNSDSSAPYAYSWASTAVANGSHTIGAVAYDAAGNASSVSQVTVTVSNTAPPADTTAPTVSLTAPASGATLTGTANLAATASDNVGVARVEFRVDGTTVNSDSAAPYAYSWASTAVANGTHTIGAVAYDAAGNASSVSQVTVTVANTAPTARRQQPRAGGERGTGARRLGPGGQRPRHRRERRSGRLQRRQRHVDGAPIRPVPSTCS